MRDARRHAVPSLRHGRPPRRRHLRAVPLPLRPQQQGPGEGRHRRCAGHAAAAGRPTGPPTWGWPPTTSSSRSATTCGPATSPRPACPASCWPSSRWWRRPWRSPGSPCGPRSPTRPTTPWPPPRVMAAADDRVEQVMICTPDKDLGQCVGGKVVQFDRRKGQEFDAAGVEERLGVPPASIPDLLALVGDSADGFPGLPGWGAKSAAAVLRRWGPPGGHPRRPGHLGRRRPGRGQAQRRAARASSSWRCCSGASPRWRPTRR